MKNLSLIPFLQLPFYIIIIIFFISACMSTSKESTMISDLEGVKMSQVELGIRLNEFEKAYEEALKYDVPALFWGPMLRAATLGQLDRQSEAQQHISDLKSLKPDFESKAQYLISRYVKEDELVEKIIDGLVKAGLHNLN
jgi:hypothetical protein